MKYIILLLVLLSGCISKTEYLKPDKTYILEDGQEVDVYRTGNENIYTLDKSVYIGE